METLDAALTLAVEGVEKVIPIDSDTVVHARNLIAKYPSLTARYLFLDLQYILQYYSAVSFTDKEMI